MAEPKSYEEFRDAIGMRESSGNYGHCSPRPRAINQYKFLGKYQFGMARLCDLGLTRRKPGHLGMTNDDFEFIPPLTRDGFLADQRLQDLTFDRHVRSLAERLMRVGNIGSMSGAVAAAHLVGYQAFLDWHRYGKLVRDANGVSVGEYYEQFSGYQIP